jgi:nitrate/nitrite transporter NarK
MILRAEVAGAAMGLINAIGKLGGFLGPYVVGYERGATGGGFSGFLVLAVFLLTVAGIFLLLGIDGRGTPTSGVSTLLSGSVLPHAHAG